MKISAGVCHVEGRLIANKYFQSQPGLYTSVRVIPKIYLDSPDQVMKLAGELNNEP